MSLLLVLYHLGLSWHNLNFENACGTHHGKFKPWRLRCPPCAPTSVRGRFEFNSHFLAWKNTTNALECWKPQSKSFSILCKFRSQKSALGLELDAGQLPRLCTALFVWRRSRSWTLQHQFPASNASPTIRSREPPFWASFGHFNMRKRWINHISGNVIRKSEIQVCNL